MDLSDFDALISAQDTGIPIEILHPTTFEPIGMTMMVAGPDSERVRAAQRAFLDRQLSKKRHKLTAEQLEAEAVRKVAAAVIGWSSTSGDKVLDTILVDGENLKCTPAAAVRVLQRFAFIREQVESVVGDRADFLAKTSGISAGN